MKYTSAISILVLLLPVVYRLNAQNRWAVGVSFQPYRYWLDNDTDDEQPAKAFSIPVGNGNYNRSSHVVVVQESVYTPTGFAIGGHVEYQILRYLHLRGELLWSRQTQKYLQNYFDITTNGGDASVRLDYIMIPLIANIGIGSSKYFYVGAGVQPSFLASYRQLSYFYSSTADVNNRSSWSNGSAEFIFKDFEEKKLIKEMTLRTDWIYKRWVLGVVGRMGAAFRIGESLCINAGIRLGYDLTNMENKYAKDENGDLVMWAGVRTNHGVSVPLEERSASHNIRLGLELSIQRYIR